MSETASGMSGLEESIDSSCLVAVAPTSESAVHRTLSAWVLSVFNLTFKIGGNVAIIPLALRFLGRQEYGLWIILQSVGTYLTLSELGIGQTVLNFQNVAYTKGDRQGINRILTTVFGLYWIIIGFAWVLAAIIFLTRPVETWFLKDGSGNRAVLFRSLVALVGTLALLRVPLNVFPATLLGLRELTLRQYLELALAVSVVVGTIVTLLAGGRVLALILVTNVAPALVLVVAYLLARAKHPYLSLTTSFWTPSLVWPLLSNSLFFFLYGLGLLFQRLAGSVLAGKFIGLEAVPAFFVLFTLFRVVGWSLADTISQTMQPYIIMFDVQGQRSRVEFFAQLSTKITFAAAVVYSVLIWLFADVGIRVWVGRGMFLGYGPLALLAGSFLIDVLFLSTNNFMRALNRHRGLSVIMTIYAVFSFVLGIAGAKWWMPEHPALGLCWGLFTASVLGQALPLPWLAKEWLRHDWATYLERFLVRPVCLGTLGAALSFGFLVIGKAGDWSRGVCATLALALLPLATWLVAFDEREREWLRALTIRSGIGPKSLWTVISGDR